MTPNATCNALTGREIEAVQAALLQWFGVYGRTLPWRETRDPWAILVAEVMLQQTQVDRVLPYYLAFLERFPSVEVLAMAPTADVIRAWAGLGYNRRAVNLQRTARTIVNDYEGVFPRSVEELAKLPGIGPYTAGAICCFAFEQDVAFLDTNMKRVLTRLVADGVSPEPSLRQITEIATSLVPLGNGWSWNQALIEFGALQCTARQPGCATCCLLTWCKSGQRHLTGEMVFAIRRGKPAEPFAGSSRYYRGRILAAVSEAGQRSEPIMLAALAAIIQDEDEQDAITVVYDLVRALEKDGLLAVAEPTAAYDTIDPGSFTVTLPL